MVLEKNCERFEDCLKGFRNCKFINYTAIGMPFQLDREDVLFNLVSLQQQSTPNPMDLNNLSINSISCLLLNQFNEISGVQMRVPPFYDRRMIFNLLSEIEPEPFELKGPEHVSFVEGEIDYLSGFPDARNRQIKLNLLYNNNNESFEIETNQLDINFDHEFKEKEFNEFDFKQLNLFFIDESTGDKFKIYSKNILNWAICNNKTIEKI